MARDSLEQERATGFADVRDVPLTPDEAGRVVLGGVDRRYHIVPPDLASEDSLFDAMRIDPEDPVYVHAALGESRIADLYVSKVGGHWASERVGQVPPESDRALTAVNRAFPGALGGSPDETRSVEVYGSEWVIARRGSREVAGFVDVLAYGTLGDSSVRLPAPPTVISDDEFRALLGKMKARQ